MSSFLDYLDEHRGHFIDHRVRVPVRPAASALDVEAGLEPRTPGEHQTGSSTRGGGPGSAGRPNGEKSGIRRRRAGIAGAGTAGTAGTRTPARQRYNHVRPAFAPAPYADPLPYDEPWERAHR